MILIGAIYKRNDPLGYGGETKEYKRVKVKSIEDDLIVVTNLVSCSDEFYTEWYFSQNYTLDGYNSIKAFRGLL